MRHFFFIILFGLIGVFCFAGKLSPIVYPPDKDKECNLSIYSNYIIFSNAPFFERYKIHLSPNFLVYESDSFESGPIGEWRVSNDTLLIFTNWGPNPYEQEEEKRIIEDSTILYDIRAIDPFLHLRQNYDNSFPRNVSAFKIINHGDSLYALADEKNGKGFAISKKAFSEPHHDIILPHEYIKTYWEDTLVWKATAMPVSNCFVVEDIGRNDSRPIMVTARNSGIAFNILNPRYYPQPEAKPFDSAPYTAWFDSAAAGDTIALALSRPAYAQDVFDHSPYLRGYPDTIYVMDHEAYGYWFARPITVKP